jgi:hypothetical protein
MQMDHLSIQDLDHECYLSKEANSQYWNIFDTARNTNNPSR